MMQQQWSVGLLHQKNNLEVTTAGGACLPKLYTCCIFSEAMYQISMLDRLAIHCGRGVLTAVVLSRLSPVCRKLHGKDAMVFGRILEQIFMCRFRICRIYHHSQRHRPTVKAIEQASCFHGLSYTFTAPDKRSMNIIIIFERRPSFCVCHAL